MSTPCSRIFPRLTSRVLWVALLLFGGTWGAACSPVQATSQENGESTLTQLTTEATYLLSPPSQARDTSTALAGCVTYHGKCTSFGGTQCITAPADMRPDAPLIKKCCDGWMQYPWITACSAEPDTDGCGFCFW